MEFNIWGNEGCIGPNEKPCHACCIGLRIEGKWRGNRTGELLEKDELVPCTEIDINQPQGHCGDYNNRPVNCENYHCSSAPKNVQLLLLEVAAVYMGTDRSIVEKSKDRILDTQ